MHGTVCSAVSPCFYHRVSLAPRQNLPRIILKGIFQGVKVVRGPDWDWGNQDGEWCAGVPLLTLTWHCQLSRPPTWLTMEPCLFKVFHHPQPHNILTSRLINPWNVVVMCVCVHLYFQWFISVCSTDVPVFVYFQSSFINIYVLCIFSLQPCVVA